MKPPKLTARFAMPYGCGSMQKRGAKWWLIFRGADGRPAQQNTKTADEAEARAMLVDRAITTLEANLDYLRTMRMEIRAERAQAARERYEALRADATEGA